VACPSVPGHGKKSGYAPVSNWDRGGSRGVGVQRVPWNPPFGIALILLDELLTAFSFNLVNQKFKTSLLVEGKHLLLRLLFAKHSFHLSLLLKVPPRNKRL